jgi:hypothetical protein
MGALCVHARCEQGGMGSLSNIAVHWLECHHQALKNKVE